MHVSTLFRLEKYFLFYLFLCKELPFFQEELNSFSCHFASATVWTLPRPFFFFDPVISPTQFQFADVKNHPTHDYCSWICVRRNAIKKSLQFKSSWKLKHLLFQTAAHDSPHTINLKKRNGLNNIHKDIRLNIFSFSYNIHSQVECIIEI